MAELETDQVIDLADQVADWANKTAEAGREGWKFTVARMQDMEDGLREAAEWLSTARHPKVIAQRLERLGWATADVPTSERGRAELRHEAMLIATGRVDPKLDLGGLIIDLSIKLKKDSN